MFQIIWHWKTVKNYHNEKTAYLLQMPIRTLGTPDSEENKE